MKGRKKPSKKFYEAGEGEHVPSSNVVKKKSSPPPRKTSSKPGPFKSKKRTDYKKAQRVKKEEPQDKGLESMRLNQYISRSGVCSRRDADQLIAAGKIIVNGKVVTELGTRVSSSDRVKYMGKKLNPNPPVYILMNKPKDCICTADDPEGRNTVLDIISGELEERVFSVGRLDRNTTGVLLLTNDGELSQKLTHPSSSLPKIYAAQLDKPLAPEDLQHLLDGVELEDGKMVADEISYTEPSDHRKIGIRIHSGRNHIIHRMFEHLQYRVERLDRVLFAGLDKRGLKRGEWRFLKEKELQQLKRLR